MIYVYLEDNMVVLNDRSKSSLNKHHFDVSYNTRHTSLFKRDWNQKDLRNKSTFLISVVFKPLNMSDFLFFDPT